MQATRKGGSDGFQSPDWPLIDMNECPGACLQTLTFPMNRIVRSLAFTPDGQILGVGGDDGVVLWRVPKP